MSTDKKKALRYGHLIRIHGDNFPKGLIISKGFIQKAVYYQTYKNLGKINNYRESLFQVLPKGSFDIHDEFIKTQHRSKDKDLLTQRIKTEMEQYLSIVQSKINEEVLFGQEIVFKHVDSEEFLSGSYTCSEFSTDAFKVELQSIISSDSLFKLKPFNTYQKEGQVIYFDEPVILLNERQKFYFDYVEDKQVALDSELGDHKTDESFNLISGETLDEVIRRPQSDCKRYESVITQNRKTSWRFKLHETNEQRKDKQKIKPYDLIQLQFSKNGSYLAVESSNIVLKEMRDILTPLPLEAIWEIQPIQDGQSPRRRKNHQNTYNPAVSCVTFPQLVVQDSQFPYQEDQIAYSRVASDQNILVQTTQKRITIVNNQEYLLRHFITGKTMTSNQVDEGYWSPELSQTTMNSNQCLEITLAKQGVSDFVQNSYVNISFAGAQLQLVLNKHLKNTSFMVGVKKHEEDFDYAEHKIGFLDQQSIDAFQVHKVSEEVKHTVLFVMSGQEDLYYFVQILQAEEHIMFQELDQKVLNRVIDILKQLLSYVQMLNPGDDPEKIDGQPKKERQKCIKELHIVELLMQVLVAATNRGLLQVRSKRWKNERDKIGQIFKLSYMLIRVITKNNKQIKLHVSQWLELFLQQAMIIDEVTVQASLTELLDDNHHAISKFITQESIQRVVDILRQQVPHEKYLRILSSICICQGKAVTNNQNYILELFFKKVTQEFSFKFKKANTKVLIHCHIGKESPEWRTLKKFHNESYEIDEGQSWGYFLSYINLLSDICGFRNKASQDYVASILPIDTLCSLIEDECSIETNSLENLLKLIHLCYVDHTTFLPIRLISRVMEWDQIEDKAEIHRSQIKKEDSAVLMRIMEFVGHYITNFQYFNRKNRLQNQTLLRVLHILKSTIELGFWRSATDLKQILHQLLRICSCRRDFEFFDEDENDTQDNSPGRHLSYSKECRESESVPFQELKQHFKKAKSTMTKKSPENQLIMQNKIKACEIMELIINLELNVRVIQLTQALKRIVQESLIIDKADLINSVMIDPPSLINKIRGRVLRFIKFLESKYSAKQILVKESSQPDLFLQLADKVRTQKLAAENGIYDVDKWTAECMKILTQRDIFINLAQGLQFELVFAEISLFDNPLMMEYALTLLNKVYGQRRELFQNFQKIIIISDKEILTKQLANIVRQVRDKLVCLGDKNIHYATVLMDSSICIWRNSEHINERGIIQDLNFLSETLKTSYLKNKGVIRQVQLESLNNENIIRSIMDETEENEKVHQSLFKAQDIHDNILTFIGLVQDIDKDQTSLLKLLDMCYQFLTLLIWNNPVNKIEITFNLRDVYKHLAFNISSVDFVRELFSNNRELLYNTNEVKKLLEVLIAEINRLPANSHHKGKLMDVLRIIQCDDNKIIKLNQLTTLSHLQQKQNDNVMFILKGLTPEFSVIQSSKTQEKELGLSMKIMRSNLWNESQFKDWINNYTREYAKALKTYHQINLDPQLQYMITYFAVFAQLIVEKNKINAEKCRGMHPYKALVSLLMEATDCWPIQQYVRAYINRLYYIYNEFENISFVLIEYDITNIEKMLGSVVHVKEGDSAKFKTIKIANPVRYHFMFTYVFATLQELLFSLKLILVKEEFLLDLEETLDQHALDKDWSIHVNLFLIATHLKQIEKLWFKSIYIVNFCQQLINILKCVFDTFSVDVLANIDGELRRMHIADSDIEVGITKEQLITKMINFNSRLVTETEVKFNSLQQCLRRMFHTKQVRKGHEIIETKQDENRDLNLRHTRLVKHLLESGAFVEFQEAEFNALCNQLDLMDDLSQRVYGTPMPIITLKEFIKNIIQMNIHNPECLNDELKIFFLKVLVRMISEKNKNTTNSVPIDEWTPEFWSDSRRAIEEEQNFLDECGAASLIFQMFRDVTLEDKLALCSQLIIFTNSFLLGGNTRCQNSMLQRLKLDSTNSMLVNFQCLIKKCAKFVCQTFKVRSRRRIRQGSTANPLIQVIYVDNMTFYHDQTESLKRGVLSTVESQKSILQKQISIQVMCRAFRMLQLLCENNNVHFKNYLREQTDKDDQCLLNSINFVEFATKELSQFFKIMNKDIISIPMQIVDFINEIIQLPCLLNQNALCKSTFIEDACFSSQFFINKHNLKTRGFGHSAQMAQLHTLYSKFIQSIMQVLEGNDAANYEVLQTKLDSKLLTEFIRQILTMNSISSPSDIQRLLKVSRQTFPEQLESILNVAIIKEKLQIHSPDSRWVRHFMEEVGADPRINEIFAFCQANLRKIEIFYEGNSQMVFFPCHPVFNFLSDQTRDKIMFNVPRDTQREKLIEMLSCMDTISAEIEYNYTLNQQRIAITYNTITNLVNFAQSLSLIINVIMVYSYVVIIGETSTELQTEFYEEIFLHFMGWLQLAVSILIYAFYLASRAPLELRKLSKNVSPLSGNRLQRICKFFWAQAGNVYQIFKGDDFLQYTFYVLISVAGAFYNTYYFSLHLFYIFSRLSLLQSVFQAISHNASQLCVVALLGVLFQFVFSIIGFKNYVDDIYPQKTEVSDQCHSLVSCMITLMTSGVIGGSMSEWDPLKFLFDTVYFVFFALLFTNIVSGIMIDTFAELRDQRQKIDLDKKNLCYICGIDRATLEKNQEEFDDHIASKHFLWNYIFYLYCLQKKDSTEYTGLEYWIMDKVEKENIIWFPVVGADNNDLEQKIDSLGLKMDTIIHLLTKKDDSEEIHDHEDDD